MLSWNVESYNHGNLMMTLCLHKIGAAEMECDNLMKMSI
jgi:hypothetical protein